MKNLHLILVLFSIASMFTSFGVYDVDAAHDNKNGKANSNGCDKDNNPNQAKNNPHCYETSPPDPEPDPPTCVGPPGDCDGDGIPDSEDACIYLKNHHMINGNPDHDNDGTVDSRDKTPCG